MENKQRYRVSAFQQGDYENFKRWDFLKQEFVEESSSTTSTLSYNEAFDVFLGVVKTGGFYYYTITHFNSYQNEEGVWEESVAEQLSTATSPEGLS